MKKIFLFALLFSLVASADTPTPPVKVVTGTGLSISHQTISLGTASSTTTGALTSTDWNRFNSGSSYTFTAPLVNTSGTVTCDVASGSQAGCLSSSDWSVFNGKQSALTFGDLIDGGTDGITVSGGTGSVIGSGTSLSQHVADTSHNGYLSSSDWNTFNSKQGALTFSDSLDNSGGTVTLVNDNASPGDSEYYGTNGSGVLGYFALPVGTVTSVGMTVPSWLSVSGSPITNSGTLAISGSSQSANLFLASPNGTSGAMSPRAIVGADLPNPSSSSLGGVQSYASVSHQWINTISTSGVPSSTQPACGDLSNAATSCSTDTTNASNISSGTLGAARLPTPTGSTLGGVESITSVSHEYLTALSTSGVFSQARPACGDLSDSVASCSTDTTNASNISSGTLNTAQLPSPFTSGSASGNTSTFATTSGTLTSGDCVKIDASGNLVDAGGACGGGGGSGTVTSVAMTVPSWLTVSGSPVTTSGTLAVTGTSESANQVLASPNGSSGAMTPRALVAADLPSDVAYYDVSQTWTASQIDSTSGALSTPVWAFTGSPVTGGTATTTKPMVLLEDSGNTSTGWNTSGTYFGINGKSGFSGYALAIANNGTVETSITPAGTMSTVSFTATSSVTTPSVISGNNTTLNVGNSRTFSSANSTHVVLDNGQTDSATSGTEVSVEIKPTYNQTSGTASNTDLLIKRTETAVGSGTQLLLDAQTGSTDEFKVDHSGNITAHGTTLTMANIASVTPGTAACWSGSGVLGTDASNCIASLREYKQDIKPITGKEALATVKALGKGAVYYRYTDKFLGKSKNNPHARDSQPGFIAEDVEKIDPRYASYNGKHLRGVKYEQLAATEAAAIRELSLEIEELRKQLKSCHQ